MGGGDHSQAKPALPGPAGAFAAWLLSSDHLFAKIVRFGAVGVMSGLIYGGVTALCVIGFGIAPVPATVIGYCVSVPMSFFGHRQFSFRADGHWTVEAVRFLFSQAVNLSVTTASMDMVVNRLGQSYYWGMAITVVLVPIANFTVMNLWVFRRSGTGSRQK